MRKTADGGIQTGGEGDRSVNCATATIPKDIDTVMVTGSNPRADKIETLLKASLAASGFEKIAQYLVGVDARSGNKSSKKTSILCLKLLKAGEVLCRCSAV